MTHVPDPAPVTPATRATHATLFSTQIASIAGYSTDEADPGPNTQHMQHTSVRQSPGDPKGVHGRRPLFWSDRCDKHTASINRPGCECAIASIDPSQNGALHVILLQLSGAGRRAESPRNPKPTGCTPTLPPGVTADPGIAREVYGSARRCPGSHGPRSHVPHGPHAFPENAGD